MTSPSKKLTVLIFTLFIVIFSPLKKHGFKLCRYKKRGIMKNLYSKNY